MIREDFARTFFARLNVDTRSGQKILEGNFHFIEDRPGTSIALLRDVTDKVALEKRLLRQNQDLAAVNLISKTLSSSIELEEILQNTLVQVLQIMNIEVGWIYLLNEDKQKLKCAYSHGLPDDVAHSIRELDIGEGIAGRVARYPHRGHPGAQRGGRRDGPHHVHGGRFLHPRASLLCFR